MGFYAKSMVCTTLKCQKPEIYEYGHFQERMVCRQAPMPDRPGATEGPIKYAQMGTATAVEEPKDQ